jgi:hypothetical protein
MTDLTSEMESWNGQLQALQSHQAALLACRDEYRGTATDFANRTECLTAHRDAPQHVETSTVNDLLLHVGIDSSVDKDIVENVLLAKERKLQYDIGRCRTDLEIAVRGRLNSFPLNIRRLVTNNICLEDELAELEKDMHRLKEGLDRMESVSRDQDLGPPSRFVANWGC